MPKLGIAGKIWVSISVLGLGFLLSLISGWQSKRFMDRRVAMIRDLHLPRILAGQEAFEKFKQMDQLYTNAVLFGETEILQTAGERNAEVRTSLDRVVRTVDPDSHLHIQCDRLASELESFHQNALPVYTDLATFPDKEADPVQLKELKGASSWIEAGLKDVRRRCRLLFEDDLNRVLVRMSKQQQGTAIAFLVFSMIAAFSTFYILNRKIIHPIKATMRAARSIAAGEYSDRLKYDYQDEVGDLARSFNLMTAHLQSTLTGLEKEVIERRKAEEETLKLNIELENRVEKRTKDLSEANRELKDSMEKLRVTQKKLLETEKMASLGSLVAGVAHEINTPIGVSVTMASHLSTESDSLIRKIMDGSLKKSDLVKFAELSKEGADILHTNLEQAATLVKSFKQVAVDQENEEIRRFELHDYVNEIMSSLAPQLKKTAHSYDISCPEGCEIYTYPGALTQIISNLVNNSMIHGFSDSESGNIRLEFSQHGEDIRFHYSDDGKGIAQQDKNRIFEPFFTTRRSDGGSGLGLHIVYNLVTQKLEGEIACRSTPGKGTTFEIEFPCNIEEYKTSHCLPALESWIAK